MSYLHCPACSRAYNAATHAACPHCPAALIAGPSDRGDDLASAVDRLARALADATPAERAACMQRLAGPEPIALAPVPQRAAPRRQLLATIAFAVLDRLAPHAPRRLSRVVARVKALAA